ncbi:MAG: replicative helicase loader/inhibitor [Roseburia sp.]|nr:replicative helicase loader/inhibitor [Roseburia sp.]
MTRKEMTEIFTVMSLAWPNAEMFKGGVERLGPTITLWTSCLPDVDFWTAQQTVVKLCRECKFPPTIAEFKEKAEAVNAEIRQAINEDWNFLTLHRHLDGGIERYIRELPNGSKAKTVIMAMGGMEALFIEDDRGRHLNFEGFRDTYTALIRKDPALYGGTTLALGSGQGKERKR